MELLFIFYSFLSYGEQTTIHHSTQSANVRQDNRVEKLSQFFRSFNSPFQDLSVEFVETADRNGLDYRLLPVVACVESSCGKHYKRNAFGWGSDNIDFGNDVDDIGAIASKISKLSYYEAYRQSGGLYDFALAYNRSYAEEYFKKLKWFWKRI